MVIIQGKDKEKMNKIQRYRKSMQKLNDARLYRMKEKAFRIYIENNDNINIFNYLYYKYISKDFQNWLITKYINLLESVLNN